MAFMTDSEYLELIDRVLKEYHGDIRVLTNAIGALSFGRVYGWRVLRLTTSSPSYTKYQRVLGIEFKTVLREETEYSERSLAYAIVKKVGNFWKVVSGAATIERDVKNQLI